MRGWVPIPLFLADGLPLDRPYSRVEAAYSVNKDRYEGRVVTLRAYARLWQWSPNRVGRFLKELNIESGGKKTSAEKERDIGEPQEAHENEKLQDVIKQTRNNDGTKLSGNVRDIGETETGQERDNGETLYPQENAMLQGVAEQSLNTDGTATERILYRKEKNNLSCASPPPKRTPSGDHQTFLAWWSYAYERTQGKPYLTTGKDFRPVKEMLATYGLKPLVIMACWFLTVDDAWLKSKRDITMFKSQVNRAPGPKDEGHNASAYYAAGILPPPPMKFEDWRFWEQDAGIQEAFAL